MILTLIAVSWLAVSPAAADGPGTCANCHTQPQKQTLFPLQPQPFFGNGSKPLSRQDEAALRAWLAAQDGQVEVAPQDQPRTFPARLNSTPCIYNCHAPNPSPKPDFSLVALSQNRPTMDPAAIRAWLGYPSQPGNPATAAVDSDGDKGSSGSDAKPDATVKPEADPKTAPRTDPQPVPKPDPRAVTPAPKTSPTADRDPQPQADPKPQPQVDPKTAPQTDPKTTEQPDAKTQLEQTAADGKGGVHFDGSKDAAPLVGDLSVDASGDPSAKSSPVGEVYLKPKGPSSEVAAPPKPPASEPVDTDPKGPRDWYNSIGYGSIGLGVGLIAGAGFGPVGVVVGGLLGAALGGVLGMFF